MSLDSLMQPRPLLSSGALQGDVEIVGRLLPVRDLSVKFAELCRSIETLFREASKGFHEPACLGRFFGTEYRELQQTAYDLDEARHLAFDR